MKQFIKPIYLLSSLFLAMGALSSCMRMDDYLKYTDGKEILYTGIPDSIALFSGYNRVVFRGLLTSDPKIAKIRFYWNMHCDSLEQEVKRTPGTDILEIPIPVAEGTYNFEIRTYDKDGLHPSVPFNITGSSYGDPYQSSLTNRFIRKVEKVGDDVTIQWSDAENTSLYVMVYYTDKEGVMKELKVENKEETTLLKNFKSMTKFDVETYFLPDEQAIDIFKADAISIGVSEDITALYLKNFSKPFSGRDKNEDNKWGLLNDWSYTPNILNQSGGKGGWSEDWGDQCIHLESKDWAGEGITNAKLYQTFTLPAGNYRMESETAGGSPELNGYFVATKGTALPDLNRVEAEALGYGHWTNANMSGKREFTFSLTEPTLVTIGWVTTFGTTTWLKVNYVKLLNVADEME